MKVDNETTEQLQERRSDVVQGDRRADPDVRTPAGRASRRNQAHTSPHANGPLLDRRAADSSERVSQASTDAFAQSSGVGSSRIAGASIVFRLLLLAALGVSLLAAFQPAQQSSPAAVEPLVSASQPDTDQEPLDTSVDANPPSILVQPADE